MEVEVQRLEIKEFRRKRTEESMQRWMGGKRGHLGGGGGGGLNDLIEDRGKKWLHTNANNEGNYGGRANKRKRKGAEGGIERKRHFS